jgi:zinc protease
MRLPWIVPAMLCAALFGQGPAPRKIDGPSYKDLKFPPLAPVKIPQVEIYTMPNGMRVYLLENHELPLVSGLALVRTGNLFDPADKIGLATMTGMVMRTGGTRAKTGDQLDQDLENVAASVESSIGETSGEVSFSALRDNGNDVLSAFHDVLTEPEFRQDKIDLAKVELRGEIARRNDDAEAIASREFRNTVYGKNTPYGWQIEYSTLDRIQRDDLIAFYRRYFFPANVMLAVYGDFSTADMKARLERLFGAWNRHEPAVPPFPPVEAKPRPGVFLATKEDVNQTVFFLGHLGGELREKDDPALEIMADILGGGFSSRLFKRVRTALGYAYGIGADWSAGYDHPGVFEISGSTKSQTTTDAIEVTRQEAERIRTSEVADAELETAKGTALNGFVFNFDTPSKTLSRILRYEYYGYPRDFIFQFQKALAAVTKADVLRAAKQHVRPQDFTIVAAGNPAEFGKPLTALGVPVHPIDLTIPPPVVAGQVTDASKP